MTKKASFLSNGILIAMLVTVLAVAYSVNYTNLFASVSAPVSNGRNSVSLLISVQDGTEFVEPIMDLLQQANASATFFLGGSWVNANSNLAKKIAKNFEIGNSGFSGKDLKKLSYDENYNDIYSTHVLVKGITDVSMTLFLPPKGSYSKNTLKAAEKLGYKTIMYNKKATNNLRTGDFVLLESSADTLDLLAKILSSDFNFVSVSQNL